MKSDRGKVIFCSMQIGLPHPATVGRSSHLTLFRRTVNADSGWLVRPDPKSFLLRYSLRHETTCTDSPSVISADDSVARIDTISHVNAPSASIR